NTPIDMTIKNVFPIAICIVMFLFSCKKEEATSGKIIVGIDTIYAYGFDFSKGKCDTTRDVSKNTNDGKIVTSHPGTMNVAIPDDGGYIWFSNKDIHEEHMCQIKCYGEADMDTIHTINTNWDSFIDPLTNGHVYGAKCRDGYVLYKVKQVICPNLKIIVLEYTFNTKNSF
ncbi:MAG TPA: hypothetical protein P5243_10425, partial [Bacteroidales bacterium]|nr:hypothetical protein [Bacteroidales bacterium]